MRKRRVILATIGILIASLYAAHIVSPWPTVWLIRFVFAKGAEQASASTEPFVPEGVRIDRDVRYGSGPDEAFDVFTPANADAAMPAVLWVHGGGFVAGARTDLTNYLQVLAARGFIAIAIGYSRAPEARFPTPVRQTNEALAYVYAHAARFGIDRDRLFLAGDSAGAQIAAQSALVISDPSYATRLGIEPGIAPEVLRAVVLFCGPHDTIGRQPTWYLRPYIRTIVWSYMGTRDLDDPRVKQISVAPYVTADFPPAFISVGNDDPLAPQSFELARALRAAGAEVETLFFPDDFAPPLGHEYQMFLSLPQARLALDRYVAFLRAHAPDRN
jgi:acetyl esterase/lipase